MENVWKTLKKESVLNYDGVVLEIYFGSQIPVTTGGFELRISSIRGRYLTH